MKNIKVSRAVRSEAVTHAMEDCTRLPEVAKEFGVSQGELRRWVHDQIIRKAQLGEAAYVRQRMSDLTSRRSANGLDRVSFQAAGSFLEHAEHHDTLTHGDPLRLFWWPKPYPGNYGDWLSPLILQKLSSRPVLFHRLGGEVSVPHLLSVGSIGRFATGSSVLCGTGVSSRDTELAPDATYISLRGPYSAKCLVASGGPRVERFGDPAIVLPRLIQSNAVKDRGDRYALVRHFSHRKIDLSLPDNMVELSIYRSGEESIREFIDELHRYQAVITSAMHVYITCHAYGIPVALVSFEGHEGAVHGDHIKYHDYAAGAGVPERSPEVIGADLRNMDLHNLIHHEQISGSAMDEVASALGDAIAAFDRANAGQGLS